MKLPTLERGDLQLLAVWERKGVWEDFQALRGTRIGDQLSVVSQNALDHALHRLSRPLVDSLGIPPAGALRKLPQAARECQKRLKCPLYKASECHPLSKKLPWCFEPGGFEEDDAAREQAARLIQEWSQGVYVAVIEESSDG